MQVALGGRSLRVTRLCLNEHRRHPGRGAAFNGAKLGEWVPALAGEYDVDVQSVAVAGSHVYLSGDFETIGRVPRSGLGAVSTSTANPIAWPSARMKLSGVVTAGPQAVVVSGSYGKEDHRLARSRYSRSSRTTETRASSSGTTETPLGQAPHLAIGAGGWEYPHTSFSYACARAREEEWWARPSGVRPPSQGQARSGAIFVPGVPALYGTASGSPPGPTTVTTQSFPVPRGSTRSVSVAV